MSCCGSEPDHPDSGVVFTHHPAERERRRLSLRGLLTEHPLLLVAAGVLVTIVSLAQQAGPKLTEYAINDGMTPGHGDFLVVVVAAALYLGVGGDHGHRSARPGPGDRPPGRTRDERSPRQGVHPPPTPVTRLLHRGKGRRGHEPHDERHREPPAAAPGRARPVRHPGADDGGHHDHPVHHQRAAGPDHRAPHRAGAHRHCRCGSVERPNAATTRCGTGSPSCSPTSPRACKACAS